jgi:hypothetical protein
VTDRMLGMFKAKREPDPGLDRVRAEDSGR